MPAAGCCESPSRLGAGGVSPAPPPGPVVLALCTSPFSSIGSLFFCSDGGGGGAGWGAGGGGSSQPCSGQVGPPAWGAGGAPTSPCRSLWSRGLAHELWRLGEADVFPGASGRLSVLGWVLESGCRCRLRSGGEDSWGWAAGGTSWECLLV